MLPISATKVSVFDIFSKADEFKLKLEEYASGYCFFFRRGAEAFYTLFTALRGFSGRNTVIIPAYTADTVYLPIKQAGCSVKFCDMSLKSFNMDLEHLEKLIDDNTLAVVGVHLFGIPEDMDRIKNMIKGRDIYLIDDFCQAFGSRYKNRPVGTLGDASVLSFGKGKNLTTVDGGALFTSNSEINAKIADIYSNMEKSGVLTELKYVIKIFGLSVLTKPILYGIARKIFSGQREVPAPDAIEPKKLSNIQKRMGSGLIKKKEDIFEYRHFWGQELYEGLSDIKGIILPDITNKYVVWNRFPVLIEDKEKREKLRDLMLKNGIECNFLYGRPVYDNYGIEINVFEYKNAEYMAKHLITLPTNQFMNEKKLVKIRENFLEIL